MVDLFLLASCSVVVISTSSSFGGSAAALGGLLPYYIVGGCGARQQHLWVLCGLGHFLRVCCGLCVRIQPANLCSF